MGCWPMSPSQMHRNRVFTHCCLFLKAVGLRLAQLQFVFCQLPTFCAQKVGKKASAYEKSCRFLDESDLKNAEINQTRRRIERGHAARKIELAQTWFLSGIFFLRNGLTRPNSEIFLRPVLQFLG